MFSTLLGLILTLIPFVFIIFFKDKMKATLYFLSGFFLFHSFVAVLTQYFHIFNYSNMVRINLIGLIVLTFVFYKLHLFKKVKFRFDKKILIPIFALLIISFQLTSLHFNYSGKVGVTEARNGVDVGGRVLVENDTYTYPIYSDEWIAASLIDHSIETSSLPNINTLQSDNAKFNNFSLFHYSFLSEIFILLNLNPISNFAYMAILSGLFICYCVYLLSRNLKLGILSSTLVMLLIPYITNGANLPGIWFLIPFVVSFSLFLISLSMFYSRKGKELFYLLPLLTSFLFYPPMIVFILPLILLNFRSIKKVFIILSSFLVAAMVIILFTSKGFDIQNTISTAVGFIIRDSFNMGLYHYYPQYIIPLITYPFIIFGFYLVFKRKNYSLLAIIFIGICLWIFYIVQGSITFIIADARVILFTSIFLILLSGFAFQWVFDRYGGLMDKKYLSILILLLFLSLSFFYSSINPWEKVAFHRKDIGRVEPMPPINRYLNQDDIDLFKNIKNKIFLAEPWKGLVLAVYNNNYPLASKASVLTVDPNNYKRFLLMSCGNKRNFLEKNKVEYVYTLQEMQCHSIYRMGKTREGFILYRYLSKK